MHDDEPTPVEHTPVPTRLWHEHALHEKTGHHKLMRRLGWLIALEVATVVIVGVILAWLLL